MALQKSFVDPFGCEHPEAYWRISGYVVDYGGKVARVEFMLYHNEEARRSGKSSFPNRVGFDIANAPDKVSPEEKAAFIARGIPLFDDVAQALDEGQEIRKYFYDTSKAIPDFKDAKDC
jgi:hypothetical protein